MTDQALPAVGSVLAVCAHPDDESFGLGAALSYLAARGARVSVLCFTRGEASTLHRTSDELSSLRGTELQTAASELGATEIVLLEYPDGSLDGVSLEELAGEVAAVAARVQPDLLLVFDEGGVTGHPDHSRATEAALAGAPEPAVLAWAMPRSVAEALNSEFGTAFAGRDEKDIDLVLEVDRAVQRRAIAAHGSQSADNPVLWRRLELQADREAFRWLRSSWPARSKEPSAGGDRPAGEGLAAEDVAAVWDARYETQSRLFREEADDTLVELASALPKGTALDLGAGEGRNSLWLARHGWDVVAVDASAVALGRLEAAALAQGVSVQTVTSDLFDFLRAAADRHETFDLVVVAFIQLVSEERSRLLSAAAERVAEGGYLFVVAHHLESLGRSGPPDAARLYVEDDLAKSADGLEVVRLERRSGPSDVPEHGVDVFLWARRS